ncbi:acyltransferase family protein [Rhodopila sp.]|uniref:acyltransferase family protein n=1 Tax=Rhodopila sp. TaxID=2480087 RepID=UPI003D151FE5
MSDLRERGTHVSFIARRESLYLDLARVFASVAVLLDHTLAVFDLPWAPDLGHQAVVIFLVLSGYVIANVAETREATPRMFLVARFARLWSVLVPAMVLTVICDLIGHKFGLYQQSYVWSPIDHPLVRLAAALSFLSESWVSIQPFSNFATWSLSIEFWCYMIFAAWIFTPPGRIRVITVGVAMCFAGQKGLLLLPIWLMGVTLQKSRVLRSLHAVAGITLFFGGFVLFCWTLGSGMYADIQHAMERVEGPWLARQLDEARAFPYDWLLGLSLAVHLAGARTVVNQIPLEWIGGPVRWCAGISFAAYLFHMPLLHVFAAFLPRDQGLLGLGLTVAIIAMLGSYVERTKHWWRRWLNRLVDGLLEARQAHASQTEGV